MSPAEQCEAASCCEATVVQILLFEGQRAPVGIGRVPHCYRLLLPPGQPLPQPPTVGPSILQ